jgi:hypothetical protein
MKRKGQVAPTRPEHEQRRGAWLTSITKAVRSQNKTRRAERWAVNHSIAAALTSKHHWLIIACDSCDTVIDLDLHVKPRDPEASISVTLRDVQCPRCNGHGRSPAWVVSLDHRFGGANRTAGGSHDIDVG